MNSYIRQRKEMTPLAFCSYECRSLYYYYKSIESTYSAEYTRRVSDFYMQHVPNTLILSWFAMKSVFTELQIIEDLHRVIMMRLIETCVDAYMRHLRPSLVDISASDESPITAKSIVLGGRDILHILGGGGFDYIANFVVYIENICSIHLCNNSIFLLRGDGAILGDFWLNQDHVVFEQIDDEIDIVMAAHNRETMVTIKSDGSLWGYGKFYMTHPFGFVFPHASISNDVFMEITAAERNNICIAVGDEYIMFIKADGALWAGGVTYWTKHDYTSNPYAQTMARYATKRIDAITDRVVHVSCQGQRAYITKIDNTVWYLNARSGVIAPFDCHAYTDIIDVHSAMAADNLHLPSDGRSYCLPYTEIVSYCNAFYSQNQMFMTKSGVLYASGTNNNGELGYTHDNSENAALWQRVDYQVPLKRYTTHSKSKRPRQDDRA